MGSHLISAFLNGQLTYWILPFLFVLTVIVFFHELGHYVVARMCGVRVLVFSIGFGPELFGFNDRHGTRWKISVIPLGGYVKFFGDENEASVPDQASLAAMTDEDRRQSLPGQPVGNRAAVAAAGPIVNFVLAFVIFASVFTVFGKSTLGPRIGGVEPDSPAAVAGLAAGDLVVSINDAKIDNFNDIVRVVSTSDGAPLTVVVNRGGSLVTLKATPSAADKKLGIRSSSDPADVTTIPVSPIEAAQLGVSETWYVLSANLAGLRDVAMCKMGLRDAALCKQSAAQLGGPIMIAELSGKVAQLGFDKLLWFTAALSAWVGLLNLFPIPILDGGHLLFCAIEAVKGRPLSERALEVSFRGGLAVIATLMFFALGSDVVRYGGMLMRYVQHLLS